MAHVVAEHTASLAAVAEALSHDIKGSIGTIGLQFRLAQNTVENLVSRRRIDRADAKHYHADIEAWINRISSVYNSAETLTRAVRNGDISERIVLRNEINQKIAEPVNGLVNTLDRRALRLKGRVTADLLREARTATYRVHRILLSIMSELESENVLEPTPTNLRSRANKAVDQLFEKVQKANAHISVTGTASVTADQDAMLTMYINLIDNALVYVGPSTRPRIQITIQSRALPELSDEFEDIFRSVRGPDEWAHVAISDNGVGIAEDDRDSVFEMGYRVNNELNTDGSGFGLYRVKSIIRRHRGRIALTDSPLGGLTVNLFLPSDPELYAQFTS